MEENKKHKIPNVPNLRFPEYSSEWFTTKYDSVCKVFSGGTPKSSNKEYYKGDIPFIRSGEIHLDKTELFINEKALRESSAKMINKGDLLLALYGATSGEIDISRIEGAINQAILCIKTDQNKQFIKYGWESKVTKYLSTYLQGGQGNLSAEIFKSIRVDLTEKDEQAKIAYFLVLLDDRIKTQNKIIEEKEKLIYAINDYLYGKSPKQEYKLLSLFEQYGGLSGKTADDFGKGMPYITFLSVLNDTYVTREHTQLVDIKKEEKQNIVGYGDVVLTLSSETPEEVGIAAVNLIAEPVYLNSFCMGLKNKNKNVVYNDYLTWLFSAKKFRKHIFPYAQGSTRFNLNVSSFMNSYFELPSLDNQIKITKMLNESLRELEIEKAILSKYILQRKYLLRNLFI